MKRDVSSKHLQGITDLTLLASIKPGVIDALDTRTYTTRLKLLMKSLNSLRSSSREFSAFRPFSDGAERIRTIHSLRLAILESEQKLLLAVTFDRPWEPYIRIIWRDVGTLLDVIFCNCEGYVPAYKSSCAEYFDWVRKAQIEAQFFYNAGPVTVDDLQYLRKAERLHRENPGSAASDLAAVQLTIDDPETVASDTADRHRQTEDTPVGAETTETLGLKALTALYRLTDLYPVDKDDGGYLLRAAHEILKEFRELDTGLLFKEDSVERIRFKAQLEWFERPVQGPILAVPHDPPDLPSDIQGGILTAYKDITHGCMVLISVVDAAKARAFLAGLTISTEESAVSGSNIYVNVALTCQGLRRLGVPESEIDKFPKEFREGMEARTDLLGDLRSNHPRNWALPERNWREQSDTKEIVERVQMSEIDIVVQLRISSKSTDHQVVDNPNHPLYAEVDRLAQLAKQGGAQVLSVQALRRYMDPNLPWPREHFGFVDGIGQPEIGPAPSGLAWNNFIPKGDLLLGHVNGNGDVPERSLLRDNGTFLVVRKLRQDVPALNRFLAAATASTPISPDELKAKMLGRTVDGDALANAGQPQGNDFNYDHDADGSMCPFQAHIRRANPRTSRKPNKPDQPTVPRIMRRGMSYGPQFDKNKPDSEERGLIFMAYNASIAEQFEVIQRWISGGNSTGVFSGQNDPLLGVPQMDDPRTFRFQHANQVLRVDLDAAGTPPFVVLEWGAYLFVPSLAALKEIAKDPVPVASTEANAGEQIVQKLLSMERQGVPEVEVIEAWKGYLEDFDAKISGDTAAVWAAIREKHGGVLRTAYGVLVGGQDLVMKVFENAAGNYSVKGYLPRMHTTIGQNYLGLDDGPAYRSQSGASNTKIMSITEEDAFNAARAEVDVFLDPLIGNNAAGEASFDTRELSDQVLARLANTWFDLPDYTKVMDGGWNWNPIPPRLPQCPGDFTSPSRYLFSPNPGTAAKGYAEMHGQALHRAALDFVRQSRADGSVPSGVLSSALFSAIADDDQLARTIIGAMMGFLPTVDGTLRSVLYDWMDDSTLWRLQEALLSDPDQAATPYIVACKVLRDPLMRAMQRRPVPDLVWRTALKAHDLGPVSVSVDDKIVVGIISATNEDLARGQAGVFPVFGGNREAASHPTHACPAYNMAMGVLLGVLSALLEAGTLRPTPSPTGLTLIGRRVGPGPLNLAGGPPAGVGLRSLTPELRRVSDSEI